VIESLPRSHAGKWHRDGLPPGKSNRPLGNICGHRDTQMFEKRWTEDNPCPTGVQEDGGWLNIVHCGGDEHVIPKDLDPDRGLGRRTGRRR
jgi:hypothetical protein